MYKSNGDGSLLFGTDATTHRGVGREGGETRLLRDRVAMGDGQGSGLDVQVDNHVGLHNFRFVDHLYELSRDPGQGGCSTDICFA